MRILVPVDGTTESEIALPAANNLAAAFAGQIYLVRVIEVLDAFSPLRYDPDILRMRAQAAAYLDELAALYGLCPERTTCLVECGDDAARQILAVAQNEAIDLIVMVCCRNGWLRRLAQGDIFGQVLGSAPCPVLGIPTAPQLRQSSLAVDTCNRNGRRTSSVRE